MKKSHTFSNKIFLILCLMVSLVFSNCFALFSTITSKAASGAHSSYFGTVTEEVENGTFSSDFSSNNEGKPFTFSEGWQGIASLPASKVTAGIIDVSYDEFYSTDHNKFGLQDNPETDTDIVNADTKILMIKANSAAAQYGYETKESDIIELSAAKHYVIEVHCKTGLRIGDEVVDNAVASIYTSLSNESVNNFTTINTDGYWKTYRFYVKTDSYNTSDLSIQLKLGNNTIGSTGVVFFDQVSVFEVADVDFNSVTPDTQNIVIDLDNDYVPANNFDNANFEGNTASTWVIDSNNDNSKSNVGFYSPTMINQFIKNEYDAEDKDYANNFVYNNSNLLYISNFEKSSSKVSSHEDNNLTINQHGLYRLSMLVKTGNLSSGASLNITLNEVVEDGEAITVTQTATSSSDTLKENNGFKRVDFYIRGNSYQNKNVSISFDLGKSDSEVSGWAIIDNLTLQQVSTSEFAKKSSSNELDLAKNIKDTTTLLNGSFDFVTKKDSRISYPASPLNWSNSRENDSTSGIIRVRTEYFNNDAVAYNYGLNLDQNPGPNTSYPGLQGVTLNAATTFENVLMVRNNTENDAHFTSDEFTLSASTSTRDYLAKVQVGVKTIGSSKAYIKIVNTKDQVLAVYDNITATEWTNYTLFVKAGITSHEVKVVVGTHGDGNNNYAFFDYATFKGDLDLTLDDINSTPNSVYFNLLEDSFYSHSNNVVNGNVYETNNYSVHANEESKASALYYGIIDATTDSSIKTRLQANDNNVLVVKNTVASYQHLISNYSYKLKKNNYYEFSVWMKTDFAGCENGEKYGSYFEIVSIDSEGKIIVDEKNENKNKFKNIITSTEDDNGWIKYSMFIIAEADMEIKVLLGLGNEENLTKGAVYFDDLKVVDITEENYAAQTANDTTLVSKVITVQSSPTDKDNNSETTTPSEINIFALLSSIILVVALCLAIAGYLIRRIPKKKIAKIEKSTYTKSPRAIDEKEVKRELKATREKELEETNKKLAELTETRDKLQAEYEELLSKEENQSKKEKLYVDHTKKINKLNKEIDYLSSAVTYVSEETNIKIAEAKEIKRRKKQVEAEFIKMKTEELSKQETEEKPSKSKNKKSK